MLINGLKTDQIDALDRGLAYGDGLFSTIKVEYGEVQLWPYHLQRLQLGAQRLFFPEVDWTLLTTEVMQIATNVSDKASQVIKVILTRGSGGRGYSAEGCDSPLRIILTSAYPEFYSAWQKEGIDIIHCQTTLSSNKRLAGLKSLNRLEQVLIKHELESQHALEGIVCDDNGYVIEGCTANLFILFSAGWYTPIIDTSGVAGVQRRNILTLAAQSGIAVGERKIHKDELMGARAICLSNALMGIVPVKKYQQQLLSLNDCTELQSLIDQGENEK
ncbi:aminodeoxychorismate lyase [Psychromonas sp. psych-6C06]|uniref:aminodeoxychorismate lyase n=1 Tax=Psychromonas sp. psych-6C06 TaxID=2058089 RepID=UPI000C341CC8|nr:aminodeoxychorismate lyase [Psychromonas sp. psych-6C06]PKF62602.1 aminodeoxychorismate lyase [Psychromonas sp. psych-6C06]